MPTLLHFIVCDRVRVDPMNLHVIHIDGLRTSIRSNYDPPFPCRVPLMTTLVIFMGGLGEFELSTRITDDMTGDLTCISAEPRTIKFVGDPLAVKGVKVFVPGCVFPRPGLYWVELKLSGERIARQPIRIHS
jgi:hypothetical protein